MNQQVDKIFNYVEYLSKTYRLRISLHPFEQDGLICDSKLLVYNAHNNLYCHYIKNNEISFQNCLKRQKELFASLKKNKSIVHTCYAGVQEYVYPFGNRDRLIGYICVGSFKSTDAKKYIKKLSYDYCLSQAHLTAFYEDLQLNLPDKKEIDILIAPLCDMLELAYSYLDGKQDTNVNSRILNYIDQNYRRKLTVEELSQKFFISYSTISHKFKTYNGMSINDYITNLRIEDAKHLLASTTLTVTEIADVVGFSGVNYFINVFTKREKISPSKYRKILNQNLKDKT